MFNNNLKAIIKEELNNSFEDIEQNLINEGYIESKRKSHKKVNLKRFVSQYSQLLNDIIIFESPTNKFFIGSKFKKHEQQFNPFFIFEAKNIDVINPQILDAISLISETRSINNDMSLFKMYRNSLQKQELFSDSSDALENRKDNIFYLYIISFATSDFQIKQQHNNVIGKISNLIENQLKDLPNSLSLVEEFKILDKIANKIVSNLTKENVISTQLRRSLSRREDRNFHRQAKEFMQKINYIDLIYKKDFSTCRYIIPELLKKVKLSEESINHYISLCQEHLLDIIQRKLDEMPSLNENNQNIKLMEPFTDKTIFREEMHSTEHTNREIEEIFYADRAKRKKERELDEIIENIIEEASFKGMSDIFFLLKGRTFEVKGKDNESNWSELTNLTKDYGDKIIRRLTNNLSSERYDFILHGIEYLLRLQYTEGHFSIRITTRDIEEIPF